MEETMPQQAENLEQEIEIPTEVDSSQEVVVEASSVEHEEEIEQYSEKVQKRIDKLLPSMVLSKRGSKESTASTINAVLEQ